jgi:REP element-mobilizing transposase RayT
VGTGFLARVAERSSAKRMSYYRRNLPHIQVDWKTHFITFATHKRAPLPSWARDIVLSACRHHDGKSYDLIAAVIMPDHVHLIVVPLTDEEKNCVVRLFSVTRSIKGYSAREINKRLGRKGQVWQDESFDHVIRTGDFEPKLDYLLQNPVKKGLAQKWQEYRWCYLKQE